jgi:hypothetical protein
LIGCSDADRDRDRDRDRDTDRDRDRDRDTECLEWLDSGLLGSSRGSEVEFPCNLFHLICCDQEPSQHLRVVTCVLLSSLNITQRS